jgi:TonB family protein
MIVIAFIIMFAAGSSDPISTVDPAFPPNAVGGGTVVATLDVSNGSVTRVSMISGAEPFASSARAALAAWRFSPSPDSERVTVVVDFAQPGIYSVGAAKRRLAAPRDGSPGPYPRTVLDPQYPPNGAGQGSVVLTVDLDASGGVGKVGVVKDLGAFTQAGVQAVQQWRFSPARDASGNKRPARVYAVLVFRAPIL